MPKLTVDRTVTVKMAPVPDPKTADVPRRTLNDAHNEGKAVEDDAHRTFIAERCKGNEGPFCGPLASVLHVEVNSRRSGLTAMVADFPKKGLDGQYFGVSLVLRKGPTFALNFCPWCGADIRADWG